VALELSTIIVGNPAAQILGNLKFVSLGKIWNFISLPTNFLLLPRLSVSILFKFQVVSSMQHFQSHARQLCKFIAKKLNFYVRKWFNSYRTGLG